MTPSRHRGRAHSGCSAELRAERPLRGERSLERLARSRARASASSLRPPRRSGGRASCRDSRSTSCAARRSGSPRRVKSSRRTRVDVGEVGRASVRPPSPSRYPRSRARCSPIGSIAEDRRSRAARPPACRPPSSASGLQPPSVRNGCVAVTLIFGPRRVVTSKTGLTPSSTKSLGDVHRSRRSPSSVSRRARRRRTICSMVETLRPPPRSPRRRRGTSPSPADPR